jgi:hypothetical protein
MNNRVFGLLIAGVLGASLAIAPQAKAFHGGMGGGGMHMGGGMGGGHWGGGGGMHWGGGGAHWGGMGGMHHFATGSFGNRAFVGSHFRRFAFHDRDDFFRHRFLFRHHRHFRSFAFIGAPYGYGYDGCWRRVWTAYGPQWVNTCDYDYGY